MGSTFIIAEIGTAHAGDLGRARELIHSARECGADCAKFQCVIAREIIHPLTGAVKLPGGDIPLFERFASLEQPRSFYESLRAECQDAGIEFLCSAFGLESVRTLRDIGVTRHKIASPELNHVALLREVAAHGLPVIVSTGVSRLADIELALSFFDPARTTLLHCVTAYPAPEEQYNLGLIPSLRAVFGVPTGLSDHSQDPELVPGLSVALGATIVEKHFTLSRTGSGLDDSIAMDPVMFTQMAATIRRVDAVLSLDEHHGRRRVIAEFEAEYGSDRVSAVLGDGVKRLAPAETRSYPTTRRSLIAVEDLPEGTVLAPHHVAALRAETLSPGLEPALLDEVIGLTVRLPVRNGYSPPINFWH